MDSFKDVLEAAQSYCKAQMAEPTYNLYIDGLEPISFEDSSHITLSVRNDFICKIVTDRYLGLLKEAFKTVLGFDVDITLVVPSTPPHEVVLAQQYEANPASPQGNYEFTFENFIKGPSNQFAFAAAQAVAANPSGAYNPLFIYGGSGLGKTHLLTAIQTEIKRTHPDFVIMYVTCEQFTNELIAAIRAGSTEDFRMKYRVADLLLVDDIQFIAGKESTQEEFFHTFNSLHDAHKQIVIASDRPAKEIKSHEMPEQRGVALGLFHFFCRVCRVEHPGRHLIALRTGEPHHGNAACTRCCCNCCNGRFLHSFFWLPFRARSGRLLPSAHSSETNTVSLYHEMLRNGTVFSTNSRETVENPPVSHTKKGLSVPTRKAPFYRKLIFRTWRSLPW